MDKRWKTYRLLALIAYSVIFASALVLIFLIGPKGTGFRIISACILGVGGIAILILGNILFRRTSIRKEIQRLGRMNMVIDKCPYCGGDYPVRDDIERCPRCGGDLKLHRSVIARNEKRASTVGEDDTGVS